MPWPSAPWEDADKKQINYKTVKMLYKQDIESHHLFGGMPKLPVFNKKHVKVADDVRADLR